MSKLTRWWDLELQWLQRDSPILPWPPGHTHGEVSLTRSENVITDLTDSITNICRERGSVSHSTVPYNPHVKDLITSCKECSTGRNGRYARQLSVMGHIPYQLKITLQEFLKVLRNWTWPSTSWLKRPFLLVVSIFCGLDSAPQHTVQELIFWYSHQALKVVTHWTGSTTGHRIMIRIIHSYCALANSKRKFKTVYLITKQAKAHFKNQQCNIWREVWCRLKEKGQSIYYCMKHIDFIWAIEKSRVLLKIEKKTVFLSKWVFTRYHFQLKMENFFMLFGNLFSWQWCFVSLKMQLWNRVSKRKFLDTIPLKD